MAPSASETCAGGHVRDAGLHADAVAGLQIGDLAADFDNGACGFVAEDHGRVDDEGADAAVLVVMNVAAADTDAADADADVVGAEGEREIDVAEGEAEFLFEY